MTAFLDTNLLAYQFDDGAPEKQARAREVFLAEAVDAVISTQVMIELHAVLTRKLGRSRADAAAILAAADGGCQKILTEDLATGSLLRGVQIVNPFS